ncbi:hypothetical protein CS0771_62790 [Catellatospora sp. IY07-71]|uniref:hypothetical protein n=1 Tax=Catellatospora sp. IY07-71 TaxID=2728827 RepID=UPI001BB404C2|nr:hypothetical protein [Catellatospora sp. IY07-71]BCJ76735.1 hypothetical protein CS0771_62790 [Catellatospora sp. IY07-71]
MRRLRSSEVAELPAADEEVCAATVTLWGQVAVLTRARSVAETPVPGTVHLGDGDGGWSAVVLRGPSVGFPLLEVLPGGEILVVDARCRRYRDGTADDNAHVFDASGAHVRSFCLGDGIEQIGVDAAGSIWVAYFDEGVFGNLGWSDPLGAAGLVRFADDGRRLWSFQPPPGTDMIADCYALNVDAHTTWLCYYTDFPVVRVTDGRAQLLGSAPVRGSRALVACRDEVVLVGSYDDPCLLTGCELAADGLREQGATVLLDPDGAPLSLFRVVATRGSRLYVRDGRRILCADLADR